MNVVLVLVGGVLVALLLLWLFQRRLIYFPLPEAVPTVESTLRGADEVRLVTDDELQLGGWFLAAHPSRGTVIVFNGNAGDRSFRAPLATELARANLSVLLFDYRGYGRNPGNPSEHGLAADARAAYAYVAARPDADAARLVYFGESLGAAVAVSLALEHGPAALVLRSPFSSLEEMGRVHYPFLPTGFLLRDRFDSIGRIGELTCPVLVVAGSRDQVVPFEQSRRLYEAVRGPKRFVLIPDADHNDFALLAGRHMLDEVDRFLNEVLSAT